MQNKKSRLLKRKNRVSKRVWGGRPGNDDVCPSDYSKCCDNWGVAARCIPSRSGTNNCKKDYASYKLSSNDSPISKKPIQRTPGGKWGEQC